MTPHLLPCPTCSRHIRVAEPACPFCAAPLSASFRATPRPRGPVARLGRAALFAFGVATATATAGTACGGSSAAPETPPPVQPADPGPGEPLPPQDPEPIAPAPSGPDDPDDDHGAVHALYGVAPDMD
jgi:hypothetical protein